MRLLDTNVLIAALDTTHLHHQASVALWTPTIVRTVVAAHSIAECYSTLTRGNGQYRLEGREAWLAIMAITADLELVALTAPQTVDAVSRYSKLGVGPRLYDYLIGATGESCGARSIVTWNVRDFTGLFPNIDIVTPIGA